MTVNKLFNVWLHKGNPYATINVWDRSVEDYIFKTNPPTPNQNVEIEKNGSEMLLYF